MVGWRVIICWKYCSGVVLERYCLRGTSHTPHNCLSKRDMRTSPTSSLQVEDLLISVEKFKSFYHYYMTGRLSNPANDFTLIPENRMFFKNTNVAWLLDHRKAKGSTPSNVYCQLFLAGMKNKYPIRGIFSVASKAKLDLCHFGTKEVVWLRYY